MEFEFINLMLFNKKKPISAVYLCAIYFIDIDKYILYTYWVISNRFSWKGINS